MRHLYIITLIAAVLAYVGLQFMLPLQDTALKKQSAKEQKATWEKATSACKKLGGVNVTTTQDASGATYCITHAGQLLTTIIDQTK